MNDPKITKSVQSETTEDLSEMARQLLGRSTAREQTGPLTPARQLLGPTPLRGSPLTSLSAEELARPDMAFGLAFWPIGLVS